MLVICDCGHEFYHGGGWAECYECGGFILVDVETHGCARCKKQVSTQHEFCRSCESIIEREELASRGLIVQCLICGDEIYSAYLASVLPDRHVYWFACNVMHYRHEHVRYYENSLRYVTRHTNVSYEDFKATVNERAKRQIIRKARHGLLKHGFSVGHFAALQNTTEATLVLARKCLPEQTAEA